MKGGRVYEYWNSRDWTKSDLEIAQDMAHGLPTVKHWRRVLGKPEIPKTLTFWESLDWSKPNCEIARQIGKSPSAVCHYRHKLGKPKVTILSFRNQEITRRAASGETYQAIADSFSITRGRVEQIVNLDKQSARIDARGIKPSSNCCQLCGADDKLARHHPNYRHPKLVTWLCRICHTIADAQRRDREQSQPKAA